MTKTVLNRLVVLVCVMLMGLGAKAQTAQYLIVTLQDETKTVFALAEKPVVTMADGIFKAETPSQAIEVAIADVLNYTFSDQAPYTDIEQVSADTKPIIEAGRQCRSRIQWNGRHRPQWTGQRSLYPDHTQC